MVNIPNISDDQRAEFERRATAAIDATDQFEGTTDSADRLLLPTLIRLEEWFLEAVGEKNQALNNEVQKALAQSIRGNSAITVTVNELLDRAVDQLGKGIKPDQSPSDIVDAFVGVSKVEVDQVLIPPDDAPTPEEGDGSGWQVPRYQPRLETLIRELNRREIRTDELIVAGGKNNGDQMRKLSYAVVEIPRIWKEVTVCNQVGEASRVSNAPLGIDAYTRMTKSQLDTFPNPQSPMVIRVVCNDVHEWAVEVLGILLTEGEKDLTSRRRLDVKRVQEIRERIKEQMNVEEWLSFTDEQLQALLIQDDTFEDIFVDLGLDQDVTDAISMQRRKLMIASAVFGRANPFVNTGFQNLEIFESQELQKKIANELKLAEEKKLQDQRVETEINWKKTILKLFPTPEEWFAWMNHERGIVPDGEPVETGDGFIEALDGISEKIGFKNGFPGHIKRVELISILSEIYGDDHPELENLTASIRESKKEAQGWGNDLEQWKIAIRREMGDVDTWIENSQSIEYIYDFQVGGESLRQLIRRFKIIFFDDALEYIIAIPHPITGITTPKRSISEVEVYFTSIIFNLSVEGVMEKHQEREKRIKQQIDREKLQIESDNRKRSLTKIIRRNFTKVQWDSMTHNERAEIRISDLSLVNIGSIFNISVSPIASLAHHIQLGSLIWNDEL